MNLDEMMTRTLCSRVSCFSLLFSSIFQTISGAAAYPAAEFGSRVHGVFSSDLKVSIVNDGPTILGANTTFYATVINTTPDVKALTCSWTEWKCGKLLPYWSVSTLNSDNKCNHSSIYNCPEELGIHTIFLVVLSDEFKELGDESSDVVITEYINSNFKVIQDLTACNTSTNCTVTTKKSVLMDVDLHDPSNFFQAASITYSWNFGDGTSHVELSEPTATHTYSSTGLYTVKVNITAVLPPEKNSETKYGCIEYPIRLLDSISNLTIKGMLETTAGSSVHYNVSCNGSVPVSFCWSMTHGPPDNGTAIDNKTCLWTLDSMSCNASIKYTFNNTGTYHLRVKAINDVSLQMTETNIDVKIANVATYSSIAVALVFGILLSLISIAVVVQSYRKQRMRHVEVANFDFQGSEDSADTFSNFARRLRTMVTPPPTEAEGGVSERSKLVVKKPIITTELDVL